MAQLGNPFDRPGSFTSPKKMARASSGAPRASYEDIAFVSHADVHADRHEQDPEEVRAGLPEPEDLRCEHIAEKGHVVVPGTRPEPRAQQEGITLVLAGAVPGHEQLHAVGVAHDGAADQDHLAHAIDVLLGDHAV